MMRILPNWYIESEKELFDIIRKLANKNNINYKFVMDSKIIDEAIATILMKLVTISEEAKPEVDIETLKDLKKLQKSLRDEARGLNKFKKGVKKNE